MGRTAAKCRNCGNEFFSSIQISNSTGVTLAGNKETCPKCGHMADILDGQYDAIGDRLYLVRGPQESADVLKRLQALEEKQKADPASLTVDDVVDALGDVSPEVKQAAKDFGTKNGASSLLTFFVWLLLHAQISLSGHLDLSSLHLAFQASNTDQTSQQTAYGSHKKGEAHAKARPSGTHKSAGDYPKGKPRGRKSAPTEKSKAEKQKSAASKSSSNSKADYLARKTAIRSSRSASQRPKKT
ncbi:hypothetical protein [Gluconobacter albidus]|uniref:hypothetical protein n=1 Tax=Gluconobacter albidus TaxID=318683 RepID=UPI001B8ADD57|nr:hypothetical protein [Gluconobacter albidus]MBS1028317.1 hypothetical protein [Gluconobacter albidus]